MVLEDGHLLVKMCINSYPRGSYSVPTFGLTWEVERERLAKIGDCLSVWVHQSTSTLYYLQLDLNARICINY